MPDSAITTRSNKVILATDQLQDEISHMGRWSVSDSIAALLCMSRPTKVKMEALRSFLDALISEQERLPAVKLQKLIDSVNKCLTERMSEFRLLLYAQYNASSELELQIYLTSAYRRRFRQMLCVFRRGPAGGIYCARSCQRRSGDISLRLRQQIMARWHRRCSRLSFQVVAGFLILLLVRV